MEHSIRLHTHEHPIERNSTLIIQRDETQGELHFTAMIRTEGGESIQVDFETVGGTDLRELLDYISPVLLGKEGDE